jgi:hypothetical protein
LRVGIQGGGMHRGAVSGVPPVGGGGAGAPAKVVPASKKNSWADGCRNGNAPIGGGASGRPICL